MARYTPDHKEQTRKRLLETARAEFRKHGFDNLSIDKLMSAAGLTRGGFYAHFESKEALIKEVLRLEPGLLTELRSLQGSAAHAVGAADLFDRYLDPSEREGLINCPLVAHAMDAVRGGPERAGLYSEQVQGLINTVQQTKQDQDDREAILVTLIAVGAAILSSATPDEAKADRLQEVARDEIRRRLA